MLSYEKILSLCDEFGRSHLIVALVKLIRERKDIISRENKLCGYFAIITSPEMSAAEPLYAKIFIEFVALIIRDKIYTCLKEGMKITGKKANYMTVPAAINPRNHAALCPILQADLRRHAAAVP